LHAAKLRDLAISWLREYAPNSVIVSELSVASWGGASIDVAAITVDRIVGVEIKGEGDSPSRLGRQGLAYGMVAKEMWLLCDETIRKRCFSQRPTGWGRLEVWNGEVRPWNRATKLGELEKTKHGSRRPSIRDDDRYDPDKCTLKAHLCPLVMCGTLWRDELFEVARRTGLSGLGRAVTVDPLTEAICSELSAPIIHDEMIAALRRRSWRKEILDYRRPEEARSVVSEPMFL